MIIRSKFSVNRDDFNIQAGQKLEKVANQIVISLNVAGAHPFDLIKDIPQGRFLPLHKAGPLMRSRFLIYQ